MDGQTWTDGRTGPPQAGGINNTIQSHASRSVLRNKIYDSVMPVFRGPKTGFPHSRLSRGASLAGLDEAARLQDGPRLSKEYIKVASGFGSYAEVIPAAALN